ncbi:uncharacterized protein LOC119102872 [Pollicipes pollicipes]|uniref:uncharacterized protein LOC119102850 n=1 Tax=Pollicipes pollicipes TaxID=41117 RepID=UPI001885A1BE|nr:uncharacterized protein LOC119102850 [Pollicipes pollicipes]XP_037082220.1 uncharacterized protein LOC119102872 [Pollicipes pollicipes]
MLRWVLLVTCAAALLTGAAGDTALEEPVQGRFLFGPNYSAGKFNTTVAFTIPLFAFSVPSLAEISLGTLDTAALVSLAFLAVLTIVVLFVIPLLGYVQGRTGRNDLDEDAYTADYLTDLVYSALNEIRSVADDTCTQKTACEVWRNPYKFGYLATPIQILYPPDGYPGPRQKAALFGVTNKDKECKDEYECDFSIMDIMLYISKFISIESPY